MKRGVNKVSLDPTVRYMSWWSYMGHGLWLNSVYKYENGTAKYGYEIDFDEFLPSGSGSNIIKLSLCLLVC